MVNQLKTINLLELLESTFTPQVSLIDNLLYSGTYIFAGPPKTGKSFFVLQLAHHIASGQPLWGLKVHKKKVVYLALEDTQIRLQTRYTTMFSDELNLPENDILFCTERILMSDGLVQSMELFLKEHNNIGLIIIDTLQQIRDCSTFITSYADDYSVISDLKKLSDSYSICIIVVHHTRKSLAEDPFDMISGSNGLLGAADGGLVLLKAKRTDRNAILTIVGRDQPEVKLNLEFDSKNNKWINKTDELFFDSKVKEPILDLIDQFLIDEWSGTATQLVAELALTDITASVLGRKLNINVSELFNQYRIIYQSKRQKERIITLQRLPEDTNNDGNDGNDGLYRC